MLWRVQGIELLGGPAGRGGTRAVHQQSGLWRSCRASWLRTSDALVPLTAIVKLSKATLLSRALPGKLAPQRETKVGGRSRRIFRVRKEAAVCGRRS